jgi:hypothetical protein
MSAEAQAAQIETQAAQVEEEYHREDKHEHKVMDTNLLAPKINDNLLVMAYDDNLSTGSIKSGRSPASSCTLLPVCSSQGRGTYR